MEGLITKRRTRPVAEAVGPHAQGSSTATTSFGGPASGACPGEGPGCVDPRALWTVPQRDDGSDLFLHDGPGLSLEEIALHRVRLRLAPKTFQMFDLYVCQGLPLSTVTQMLDVSAARVLWAKYRVQRALRTELSRLG